MNKLGLWKPVVSQQYLNPNCQQKLFLLKPFSKILGEVSKKDTGEGGGGGCILKNCEFSKVLYFKQLSNSHLLTYHHAFDNKIEVRQMVGIEGDFEYDIQNLGCPNKKWKHENILITCVAKDLNTSWVLEQGSEQLSKTKKKNGRPSELYYSW